MAWETMRSTESRMVADEYERRMADKLAKDFNLPNLANIGLLQRIEGVNPAYARHMLTKNELIKAFAFIEGGGIDIRKQPMCPTCESPVTWADKQNGKPMGYCPKHGYFKATLTFEQWAMEQLKGVDETVLDAVRPKLNDIVELIDKAELERAIGGLK